MLQGASPALLGAHIPVAVVLGLVHFVTSTGAPGVVPDDGGGDRTWLGSWVVQIDPAAMSQAQLATLAAAHGLDVVGAVGGQRNPTVVLHRRCRDDRGHCRQRREPDTIRRLAAHPGVHEVTQEHEVGRTRRAALPAAAAPPAQRARRYPWGPAVPSDPLFPQQWFIDNTQQRGHDAEVLGTSLSGSIPTILTSLSWICAGIYTCRHTCGALPSPVCA